jgi:primosomal protein N'
MPNGLVFRRTGIGLGVDLRAGARCTLYGITGSGKTEVFLRAAKAALQREGP